MSLHRKIPDESGWYWAQDAETDWWRMVYLDLDGKTERLLLIEENEGVCHEFMGYSASGLWKGTNGCSDWLTPKAWIGPIGCPGGNFAVNIMEARMEAHEEAERSKKAIVMACSDTTHAKGSMGSVEVVGFVDSAEKAFEVVAKVFPNAKGSE